MKSFDFHACVACETVHDDPPSGHYLQRAIMLVLGILGGVALLIAGHSLAKRGSIANGIAFSVSGCLVIGAAVRYAATTPGLCSACGGGPVIPCHTPRGHALQNAELQRSRANN